jgi:hypothetical protein
MHRETLPPLDAGVLVSVVPVTVDSPEKQRVGIIA